MRPPTAATFLTQTVGYRLARLRPERVRSAERPAAATGPRLPHLPALDGLRAIALLAVLCFHAGFSWIHGGYLPLTAFFVLSGFLITSLLVCERHRAGRVDLRAFWGRRARRLVPAALLALGLVALYVWLGNDGHVPGFQGDVLASLGWVTNWRFILSGRSYAAAFADPSPLQHFWSLAVEEQFYLFVPPLAVGLLAVGRGRRWPLALVVTALTAASVVVMRAVHDPGDAPLRAYFGTDTRAAELLVGVLLALALVGRAGLRRFEGRGRTALDVAGALALAASVATWFLTREYDDRLYEGGLLLIALLAAVVVAAGTQPGTVVSRLLSFRPLVGLGKISYGVYLFHWPLFLWLNEERTGLARGPLFGLRMAVTIALAVLSWRLVEQPVREGRVPVRIAMVGWANATTALAAVLVVLGTALPASTITLREAGAALPPPPVVPDDTLVAAPAPATTAAPAPADGVAAAAPSSPNSSHAAPAPATTAPLPTAPATTAALGPRAPQPTAPPTPTTAPPPRTVKVMVVGDSLGTNLATGLARWAKEGGPVAVWDNTIGGCTIARSGWRRLASGEEWGVSDDCAWWGTEGGAARLDRFDPDIVLVNTGLNEIYDRKLPVWDQYRSPGDPVFDEWILSEYQAAVDVFRSRGATVVWAVPPCCEHSRFPEYISEADGSTRLRYFKNTLIPQLAGLRPITLADLYGALCPGGKFSDTVFGVANARPDGFHLTDVAAEVVAEKWLGPLVVRAAGR